MTTVAVAGATGALGTELPRELAARELAAELVRFKLDDLDAGDIRARAPREFSQRVSRYVCEAGQHDGICYRSRLGDELINWAIL